MSQIQSALNSPYENLACYNSLMGDETRKKIEEIFERNFYSIKNENDLGEFYFEKKEISSKANENNLPNINNIEQLDIMIEAFLFSENNLNLFLNYEKASDFICEFSKKK